MAYAPTKGNLINLKKSLALAMSGYELLDRKKNILLREMMTMIDEAENLQDELNTTISLAYRALQRANISLGIASVQNAANVDVDNSVTVSYRSIMGVELPGVKTDPPDAILPQYGLHTTNSALDEASALFTKTKIMASRLAELENGVYRLADAIKKTRKRANALENVVIPRFTSEIAVISDSLDEKDREEFSRMKVIKKQKNYGDG